MVFGALTPAGLTQLSGGAATGAQQATSYAMDQFLGVLTDPFVAGRSAPADEAGTNGGLAYAEDGKGAANAALTATRPTRRWRATPHWSALRSRRDGKTAGRRRQASKANSPT
jgi:hypothetical protein